MARKSWSNVFFSLSILSGTLAILPHNPLKILEGVALMCCLGCGLAMRRPMFSKPRHRWGTTTFEFSTEATNSSHQVR